MKTAVLDTHQCDPQHWLGHTLCSHPAYCTTLIQHCVITMKGTVTGQYNWNHGVYYSNGQNNDDV